MKNVYHQLTAKNSASLEEGKRQVVFAETKHTEDSAKQLETQLEQKKHLEEELLIGQNKTLDAYKQNFDAKFEE